MWPRSALRRLGNVLRTGRWFEARPASRANVGDDVFGWRADCYTCIAASVTRELRPWTNGVSALPNAWNHPYNADVDLDFSVETLESRELLSGSTYEPESDPTVGYNLVGFYAEKAEGARNWEEGVESLHASGVNHVTFAVYSVLDAERGRFQPRSGPRFSHISRAVKKADDLGMAVTITPLFEVEYDNGEVDWRGAYDPDGTTQVRFQRALAANVRRLTRLAARYDAQRINVGSELEAFVRNPDNHAFLTDLIAWVDRRFDGEIGYAANWSNYDHPAVDEVFWSNESVDAMGISAYFTDRLASVVEADSSQASGASAFEDLMTARWTEILEQELIPFATSRKDGEGITLTIQEFGASPYNRASVVPWSIHPTASTTGGTEILDPEEQRAIIVGLLRALDGHGDTVDAVHFWTWSFASNQYDTFGMNPHHANESQAAALAIESFIASAS